MQQLLFIINNFLAIYIAVSIAGIAMAGRESWRRVLASLAGFPLVVLVVVLALGMAGKLAADTALLFLCAVSAPLFLIKRRYLIEEGNRPVPLVNFLDMDGPKGWLSWGAICLFALFLGMLIDHTCFKGIVFGWDDLSYHAPATAHWLLDKSLTLPPTGYQAYFPSNSEVFVLWFMLPFGTDALAGLSGLYWGLLIVVVTIVLCSAQGAKPPTSILTATLLLASPTVFARIKSFSVVGLAGPAMALAAVAMILPPKDGRKARLADAAYIGLLSGFAAGCKVSFAPVAIVLFLWLVFSRRQNKPVGEIWCFLFGVTVTCGYWYIRNYLLTGNPLFPADFGPFEGPFGAAEQSRTKLISWFLADPANIKQWGSMLKQYLDLPFGLGIIAVIGYSVACYQWLRRKTYLEKWPSERFLLLFIGLVLLLLYPLTPFSGTINAADAGLRIFQRYLVASFAIGVILFMPYIDRKSPRHRLWDVLLIWVVLSAVFTGFERYLNYPAVITGCFILGLWIYFKRLVLSMRAWYMIGSALLLILLSALTFLAPYSHELNGERMYSLGRIKLCSDIDDTWRFLETLPPGAKVTCIDWMANAMIYPVYGRNFQLVPQRFEHSGKPLHEYWRDEGSYWWRIWFNKKEAAKRKEKAGRRKVDKKIFTNESSNPETGSRHLISKLLAKDIDYVMIGKGNIWPPQKRELDYSGQARVVYENRCSAIWKILK